MTEHEFHLIRCSHCGMWMDCPPHYPGELCDDCVEKGVGRSYLLTLVIVLVTTVASVLIAVGISFGAGPVYKTKCSWHTYANGERKFECTTRTVSTSQQAPRPQFTYPQPARPHYTDRRSR